MKVTRKKCAQAVGDIINVLLGKPIRQYKDLILSGKSKMEKPKMERSKKVSKIKVFLIVMVLPVFVLIGGTILVKDYVQQKIDPVTSP